MSHPASFLVPGRSERWMPSVDGKSPLRSHTPSRPPAHSRPDGVTTDLNQTTKSVFETIIRCQLYQEVSDTNLQSELLQHRQVELVEEAKTNLMKITVSVTLPILSKLD